LTYLELKLDNDKHPTIKWEGTRRQSDGECYMGSRLCYPFRWEHCHV